MARQLSLNFSEDTAINSQGLNGKINYDPIHISESTFLAGLSAHIHRWFRLTPSFGPDLVQEMLYTLNAQKDDYILDPFSGAGTTLIEATLEGFDSLGFEINPFLHFVNRVSLDWSLESKHLEYHLSNIVDRFQQFRSQVSFETLEECGYTIPPIHNPTRWWRRDVLTDILVLKRCIQILEGHKERNFFRLALAGVLVPDLTNVTLGRLQLHFINRNDDDINVIRTFLKHSQQMISDIALIKTIENIGCGNALWQDSTDLSSYKCDRKIDCIITSPPYPNRYSYIWNTRPHLYLLDFLKKPVEASNIDKKTIGGTWGTATSELQKGNLLPFNDAVKESVSPIVKAIRESDNLMANYAMHYFNRLTKHIVELEKITSKRLRIAYVVGNSWLKDVYVETDVLLAEILERLKLDYTVQSIHRFRRRHSGKDLFESIVYACKSN